MYSKVHQEIQNKIERENKIIQGASNLKKKTDNSMVIQKCNTNIREARQNIEYLQDQLKKLEMTSRQQNATNSADLGKKDNQVAKKNANEHMFSRLDLVKYDCPSLSQKIQYMLQQLEFKLQVEKQYQVANTKLTKLYKIDGDNASSSAAEGGAMESKSRINLLTKTLKKYHAINVDIEQLASQDTEAINNSQTNFRRIQLTGTLKLGVTAIREVDHVQSPMFSRKPDSFYIIKIDDVVKAKSKFSRSDRWNEVFDIPIEKGNEVELLIFDKINDKVMPVAVIWFLLSDIAEEIRKRKVGQTNQQQGFVDASRIISTGVSSTDQSTAVTSSRGLNETQNKPRDSASTAVSNSSNKKTEVPKAPVTINSWFILEPAGQIHLTMGFEKFSQLQNSNLVGGLHRQGAIINRNEEVFEQHGHHFVQKSFYNIMSCAYCGDFLRYSGFQCHDCKFLCHKKCYSKIVTKCIAKSVVDNDPEEAKLNHHIPHRFEPCSNRGTKWCCHCGYILPWGKQKVRKCSECNVMCHSQCAHLVPDFCGMSMEMANTILRTIQDTKRNQEKRKNAVSKPSRIDKSKKQVSEAHAVRQPSLVNTQPKLNNYEKKDFQTSSVDGKQNLTSMNSPWENEREISHDNGDYDSSKLDNFIEKNDFYNSFTANAGMQSSNASQAAKSPTRSQQTPDLEASLKEKEEAELKLWNSQRANMEQELQREDAREAFQNSQPHNTSKPNPFHSDNIQQNYNQNVLQEPAIVKTQSQTQIDDDYQARNVGIPDSPVANPFRDMHQDAFAMEQLTNAESGVLSTPEIIAQLSPQRSPSPKKQHAAAKSGKKSVKRRKVSLDDFILLKVLGKGNFGKVLLSKSKNTGRICAIKVLKKDHIIQNRDIESARAEKKVFLLATKAKHPFLTNLFCSFQTENRIYFAMEFIGGGDLMWHVQNQRLSVRRAKFYAAEVLLALKYFHDNGVIYRDLKLENILLTPQGHIKIADYGLCKDEMWYGNRTSTFCGTPEFMAPEILKEQKYTKAVDWWAFGVLLYQMLLCQSPFSGDDEDEVFNAILTDEPLYPIDMAGDIVQIFQGLLTKDPEKRLGAGPRDALEIMEEPFFHNIVFDDVLNLRVQPPYIPEIASAEDTSYFEQEFTSAPPTLTPLNSVLTTSQQEEFRGFSFMPNDLDL